MQENHQLIIKQKIKKVLPRLKCAFHQTQNLTNFCSNKKCLLPLCPSCIKIHTIQHINMKTDPQYDNLSDQIINLNLQIKDFITVFQQNHRYFVNFFIYYDFQTQTQQKIVQIKDEMFSNINNLKKSIIQEVQKYFTDITKSLEYQISEMKYNKELLEYKNQIKKTILILKKLDKNLFDQNISGKFIIRTLIKYHSNQIGQNLDVLDHDAKNILSKLEHNFCSFTLKQNLKSNIISFLSQLFQISINQIPYKNSSKQSKQILNIVKKLSQLTQKINNQKNQIKNSLFKVMNKINSQLKSSEEKSEKKQSRFVQAQPINQNKFNQSINQSKFNQSIDQSKFNQTLNFDKNLQSDSRRSNNQSQTFSQITKKIFYSNNKRSFMNHSSQRKSVNLSQNYYDQNSISHNQQKLNSENQNNYYKRQKRSSSKGKGLTLIQPNYRTNLQDSRGKSSNLSSGIRFSLSNIQNINFDLAESKPAFVYNRRK